ncbi:type II secretion system F family protein [Candidatus Kuenenbacteria bacterium]|nr:type II secretion system F family protein [Candidatus Kuenenbacteria bacterium]
MILGSGQIAKNQPLLGQKEGKEVKKRFFAGKFRQGISLRDKIFFVQNLRIMIKGGLSLGAALQTVAEQISNKYFKEVIGNVWKEVESGVTFSQALEKYPKVFSDLFINMIKSGELSGNLEQVLERLHIQMKRDHDLISKVKGAMIYPAVVLIAMVGIGTAMIIFVVPKLIAIFEEFRAQLPLPTRILIGISKFITGHGLIVAGGLFLFVFLFTKFYQSQSGKKFFHKLFLKLPVMANIVKKINLARFCRTASSLLKTDIPIVQSLKITSLVVGNIYYRAALVDASQKITKGLQINKVLSDYPKLFPPTVIQMLKVGEESGAVEEVLDEVAQFYEEDINQVMETLPSIIEPILILVLGLGVGGMAVAVIMPMYSLTQSF